MRRIGGAEAPRVQFEVFTICLGRPVVLTTLGTVSNTRTSAIR